MIISINVGEQSKYIQEAAHWSNGRDRCLLCLAAPWMLMCSPFVPSVSIFVPLINVARPKYISLTVDNRSAS
jgi:hypothetical protein